MAVARASQMCGSPGGVALESRALDLPEQLRDRRVRCRHDPVVLGLRVEDTLCHVGGHHDLLAERRAQRDARCLRVEPPVELRRRRRVARNVNRTAHVVHALDQRHDLGVLPDGEGHVGRGADDEQRHLVGVRLDGPDDEVDGVLVGGLRRRIADDGLAIQCQIRRGPRPPVGAEELRAAPEALLGFEPGLARTHQGLAHAHEHGDVGRGRSARAA